MRPILQRTPCVFATSLPAIRSSSSAVNRARGSVWRLCPRGGGKLFEPYVEDLVADGVGHVWYAAATRGPTAYTTLVARRSVLAARRAEFAAMVRGMARALRWM